MNRKEDVSTGLRLLTVGDLVQLLRLSRDTIYRLASSGELPGRKIGHTWRFPSDAVEAYVRQGQGGQPRRGDGDAADDNPQ